MVKPAPKTMPYKQWKHEQAFKLGIPIGTLESKLSSGDVPKPKTVRINWRVIRVVL